MQRPMRIPFFPAVLAAIALTSTASALAQDSLAIRAERIHVGDGTVITDGIVLFEKGVITEVSEAASFSQDVVIIEHEGDLSPGLLALREHAGSLGETNDVSRAVMDEADLAFAYNANHSEVKAMLAEGITSFVLAPRPGSLVGGQCAVVKAGKGTLSRGSILAICTGENGLTANRFPTSLQGSAAELERRFSWPTGVFARAVKGEVALMLDVGGNRSDIQRAIDFARRHQLKGWLVGSTRLGSMADKIRAAGLGVVISGIPPGSHPRAAQGAVALEEMKVPFGFGLSTPFHHPASMRLTAATCIRQGLSPATALSAMTSTAASMAGVGDKVGRIKNGLAADLVLWSGSPTDPGSRVMAVYVDGEVAYDAESNDEGDDQ